MKKRIKNNNSFYNEICILSNKSKKNQTFPLEIKYFWEKECKPRIMQAAKQGKRYIEIDEMPELKAYAMPGSCGIVYWNGLQLEKDLKKYVEGQGFKAKFGLDFWDDVAWGKISW